MFSLFCVSNLEVCCVEILSLRRQISFVLACDLIPIKRCNKIHCRLLRLNLTATKDCNFAEITIFDNFLVRYFFLFFFFKKPHGWNLSFFIAGAICSFNNNNNTTNGFSIIFRMSIEICSPEAENISIQILTEPGRTLLKWLTMFHCYFFLIKKTFSWYHSSLW